MGVQTCCIPPIQQYTQKSEGWMGNGHINATNASLRKISGNSKYFYFQILLFLLQKLKNFTHEFMISIQNCEFTVCHHGNYKSTKLLSEWKLNPKFVFLKSNCFSTDLVIKSCKISKTVEILLVEQIHAFDILNILKRPLKLFFLYWIKKSELCLFKKTLDTITVTEVLLIKSVQRYSTKSTAVERV